MASILPNGKTQFVDQNGFPLVGGSVYFYAPGTANPQATYQDSAQTIPNTNPVVLDSRGQATIWGTGTYRQVVQDVSGVTVWDQIIAEYSGAALAVSAALANTSDPTQGDALIGVKAPYATSVGRTQHDKNTETVSVRDFGAKGDGFTDDTNAINLACAALSLTGGTIYFPPSTGRYVLNGVIVNSANITWLGTGSPNGGLLIEQPVYLKKPGFNALLLDCLQSGPLNEEASNCFSVYQPSADVVMADFTFFMCTFQGFFYSVHFFGCLDSLPNADAAHTKNPISNTNILFCKSTAPAGVDAGHFQHQFTRNSLVMGCKTFNGQNSSSYNFYRDCRGIRVIGNYDANNAWGAVEIENSPLADAEVSGNTFESTATTQYGAIWVDDSANVRVFGNTCQWWLRASCNNAPAEGGNYPEEICPQTQAYFHNNTCSQIQFNLFGTYVSGSIVADAKDNLIFGSSTQAILCDQYYYGGQIDQNKATGTLTYFLQLFRTANLRAFVRGNQSGGTPSISQNTGGVVIAHDNDGAWADQTETNLQGLNITMGVIRMPPVTQFNIAVGASVNFQFGTLEATPQFSLTSFSLRCLCRSGDTPADDYVTFSVLVSNETGTLVCNVSALTKLLTNNASNFTVAASMTGAVLTIALTNGNSGKLESVQMFCENLMHL